MHDGDSVTTIEGLGTPDAPSPLQRAFLEHDGFQCGYCTPGIVMAASALLAKQLEADLLVMATDIDGVYRDWGTPNARRIERAGPDDLADVQFAAGSMGPKVEAACAFVTRTGKRAVIGALEEIEEMVAGHAGTQIVDPGALPFD